MPRKSLSVIEFVWYEGELFFVNVDWKGLINRGRPRGGFKDFFPVNLDMRE